MIEASDLPSTLTNSEEASRAALAAIPPNSRPFTVCPPLPTPTHGPGGIVSFGCSDHVAASPATCLEICLDTAHYPVWNRFTTVATIDLHPNPPRPIPSAIAHLGAPERAPTCLLLGTLFSCEVHMDLKPESTGRWTQLEITHLEDINDPPRSQGGAGGTEYKGRKGFRVAWRGRGMIEYVLRTERVQEFWEDEELGGTRYMCWETFYGIMASMVQTGAAKNLQNGLAAWIDGLKAYAEDTGRIDAPATATATTTAES
jgi:hypothetical protein